VLQRGGAGRGEEIKVRSWIVNCKALPPGGAVRKRATRPAEAQQAVDGFRVVLGLDRATRALGASR
jgi:hypothetical protein